MSPQTNIVRRLLQTLGILDKPKPPVKTLAERKRALREAREARDNREVRDPRDVRGTADDDEPVENPGRDAPL